MRLHAVHAWLAALLLSLTVAPAAPAATAARRAPVVVELFTAQGCTACPQANVLLQEVARRRGVVALTYPVDIWDYLGWPDPGARPEFTARQRAYTTRLKLREMYTPQVVVNGRREGVGFDRAKLNALIAATPRGRGPAVRFRSAASVQVAAGRGAPADVWLVRFDPAERTVKVARGENRGRTLVQQNLVRQLVRLGGWSGRARRFALPPPPAPGLRSAVILQGAEGGPVVAAAVR